MQFLQVKKFTVHTAELEFPATLFIMSGISFSSTRIAPTPSGYLHVGNVLSFAITAALARRTGARIRLRIDDLDRQRVQADYLQDIFDTLRFLEIPYDDGPADVADFEAHDSQLYRMDDYRMLLQRLRDEGRVFACNCSRSRAARQGGEAGCVEDCRAKHLSLDDRGVSWRMITDAEKTVTVQNFNGVVTKTTLPPSMKEFIVRKKDGLPAYQLTSVSDDLRYGTDIIVRGADLWDSTLAQLYLASALGAQAFSGTTFFHHQLIEEDGKKLSKSEGATSIRHLRKEGVPAELVYRQVAQMMGLKGKASNWHELADHYFSAHPLTI